MAQKCRLALGWLSTDAERGRCRQRLRWRQRRDPTWAASPRSCAVKAGEGSDPPLVVDGVGDLPREVDGNGLPSLVD